MKTRFLTLAFALSLSAGPLAALDEATARRTITLMAPSKTWNIPALYCAFAIIPDPALRRRYRHAMRGIVPHVNVLGMVAAEAAYRDGDAWRQALLDYLRGNCERVLEAVAAMPGLETTRPEATYLAWIDCRAMMAARDVADRMRDDDDDLGWFRALAAAQPPRQPHQFAEREHVGSGAFEGLADAAAGQAGVAQDAGQPLDHAAPAHLAGRQVHGDAPEVQAGIEPGLALAAGFVQHPLAQRHDHPPDGAQQVAHRISALMGRGGLRGCGRSIGGPACPPPGAYSPPWP